MSSATRSEATAAPVAAEPERKSSPHAPHGLQAQVLRMQQAAGNHAVAQTIARSPAQSIQRCGANCSCTSCSGGHGHDEELVDEELGAGLLRSAVANRMG
jgi:hypothetical protein